MSQIDIREDMRRLPRLMQPFLTWMTGKPYHGQRALWASSSFTQTLSALLSLGSGVWLSAGAFRAGGAWMALIPVGWILIAGAARKLQVTIIHQCAHFDFSGNRRADLIIGNALGLLVWVDHFANYYHDHILVHHTKQLGSAVDPDCKFLLDLGFSEAQSKAQLWRQLGKTVVSPRFHYIFARSRFQSNLQKGAKLRLALGWLMLVLGLPLAIHTWGLPTVLVGVLIPLLPVYHVAALLNFSSLHFWLAETPAGLSFKQKLCAMTGARFMGERLPKVDLRGREFISAWGRWWLRMVFVHLPSRMYVVTGDLPVHDYHHRHPLNKNWADYLYLRQRDIEAGCPRWEIPYTENWGLYNCIDAVFEKLSKVKTREEQAV